MRKFPEHIQWIIDHNSSLLKERLEEENIRISVEDAIDCFMQADPTPKKQVVDWLIKTYLNHGFLWEDIGAGKDSKAAETLIEYIKYRREPSVQRNLYDYKELGQVWQSIIPYTLKQTTLSGKQERRKERDRILQETIVLYRSELCIAAVPLTENSAKWWGRGTRWCTSADQNNYFKPYNSKAPLVILLFPKGLSGNGAARKFQIWCPNKNISGEYLVFMDENDSSVSREFITENWQLFSPFIIWAKSIEPRAIRWMPEKVINYKEALASIDHDGLLIHAIPTALKSHDMCKRAVAQNPLAIRGVPDNYLDEDMICGAVERDPRLFSLIDKHKKTRRVSKVAIKSRFGEISRVPIEILDEEMILEAIESCDYVSFHYIPNHLISYNICCAMIKKSWRSIIDVPEKFLNSKLCLTAVEVSGDAIDIIPMRFINQELIDLAFKTTPDCFKLIDQSYISQAMCKSAVLHSSHLIQYVPKKFLTEEIAKIAIENKGINLYHLDKTMKTKELCILAIQSYPRALEAVPDNIRTLDVCMLAWDRDHSLLAAFPSHLITDDLFKESIKNFPYLIGEHNIPENLLTPELLISMVKNCPYAIFSIPENLITIELLKKALEVKPMLYLDSPNDLFKVLPSEPYKTLAQQETDKKLWGENKIVLPVIEKKAIEEKVNWTPECLIYLEKMLKDWNPEDSICSVSNDITLTP